MITLFTTGHIRATHKGVQLKSGKLDQAKISVTDFRVETITIDARARIKLRKLFQSAGIPSLSIGYDSSLLSTLEETPLTNWKTKIDALPTQFSNAALAAAKLLEPETQTVELTSGTLKTEDEGGIICYENRLDHRESRVSESIVWTLRPSILEKWRRLPVTNSRS